MVMRGANWALDFGREQHKKSVEFVKEEKKKRKGKKFRYEKVCDKPLTYREVEIID